MIMTNFEEYIKQGEPDKKEKSIIWQTARAVKNNINKLKSAGIISRVGSDKTGSWKIIN